MERDLSDAVAYFRVSTDRQFDEYHSFDAYLHRFKVYGFNEAQIYSDIDSGANNQRKGYQLVLAQIRTGKKRVFVPEFTRFTRSPSGWEDAIKDFQKAGAALITLDGLQLGFDTPEELLVGRYLVANAAYEREKNQYRALKGFEYARLEGRAIRAVFGYLKEGDHLVPNHNQYKDTEYTIWDVAQEVVQTFVNTNGNLSETVRRMSRKYGTKSTRRIDFTDFTHDHSALRDWLTNQSLRGNLEYFRVSRTQQRKQYRDSQYAKSQIVYNTHEPLITTDQWLDVNRLLTRGSQSRRSPDTLRNPLQGLMLCAGCGGQMKCTRSQVKEQYYYYIVCRNAYPNDANKRIKQELGELAGCNRRSSYGIVLENVEAKVIEALCERAEAIAVVGALVEHQVQDTPEISALRQQLYQYEGLATQDPDLLPIVEKKRTDLQRLLTEHRQEFSNVHNSREKLARYAGTPEFWQLATIQERMHLYREFLGSVILDQGIITVNVRI